MARCRPLMASSTASGCSCSSSSTSSNSARVGSLSPIHRKSPGAPVSRRAASSSLRSPHGRRSRRRRWPVHDHARHCVAPTPARAAATPAREPRVARLQWSLVAIVLLLRHGHSTANAAGSPRRLDGGRRPHRHRPRAGRAGGRAARPADRRPGRVQPAAALPRDGSAWRSPATTWPPTTGWGSATTAAGPAARSPRPPRTPLWRVVQDDPAAGDLPPDDVYASESLGEMARAGRRRGARARRRGRGRARPARRVGRGEPRRPDQVGRRRGGRGGPRRAAAGARRPGQHHRRAPHRDTAWCCSRATRCRATSRRWSPARGTPRPATRRSAAAPADPAIRGLALLRIMCNKAPRPRPAKEQRVHVPDGFLDATTSLGTAVVGAGVVAACLVRAARRELDDRSAPLAGLVAVFVFAAQMLNFPVGAGTSGHLLGAALAAVLVGPATATLCLTVVARRAGAPLRRRRGERARHQRAAHGRRGGVGRLRRLPAGPGGAAAAAVAASRVAAGVGALRQRARRRRWRSSASTPSAVPPPSRSARSPPSMTGWHVVIGLGEARHHRPRRLEHPRRTPRPRARRPRPPAGAASCAPSERVA